MSTVSQDETQCCIRIYEGSWTGHRCTKRATVTREGKRYCTVHDPVRVEEKRKERFAKWDAEWNRRAASFKRQSAALAFCEGVDTETIETFVANGETLSSWLKEKK